MRARWSTLQRYHALSHPSKEVVFLFEDAQANTRQEAENHQKNLLCPLPREPWEVPPSVFVIIEGFQAVQLLRHGATQRLRTL